MNERLFIVDAYAYSYQAYYAIAGLSAPDGTSTNAVFGFTQTIWKIIEEQQPQYLAVCFDSHRPLRRHQIFPEYKANRKPMPPDMRIQIPLIKEVIAGLEVPIYECQGYEADDLMGTLALQARQAAVDVYLVSPDKDIRQLVQPGIWLYDPKQGEVRDAAWIEHHMGIVPAQIPDFLGLTGDPVDNIPGVRGIGPKGAVKLLRQWSSLENIYAHLDEVTPPSVRRKLSQYREQALLSKKLACLELRAPIHFDPQACRLPTNHKRLVAIFQRLGFRRLLQSISSDVERSTPIASTRRLQTREAIQDAVQDWCQAPALAIAVSLVPSQGYPDQRQIQGIALACASQEVFFVDLQTTTPAVMQEILSCLRPLLEQGPLKYGHHLKEIYKALAVEGITLGPLGFDTMLAGYLLNPSYRRFDLSELSLDYLGQKAQLNGQGYQAACAEVALVWQLQPVLADKLTAQQMYTLLEEIELPLVAILAEMELTGILVKADLLKEWHDQLQTRIKSLTHQIHQEAGTVFNIASPKQISSVLFDKLKLPPKKKGKSGYSTNSQVLEELAYLHPLPGMILQYRHLTKLDNTYLSALPKAISQRTGRIHTTFHQTATATGRLSSSDPNLQNIPVQDEAGGSIRAAFIAPAGYALLTADYSQIELRMLAHLSEDPQLIAAFCQDLDIHTFVASQIFEIPVEQVDTAQRRIAKTVNFGIIYGQTAYGLSKELKRSVKQAKQFITSYFERYQRVHDYLAEVVAQARDQGYVATILHRRRYLPDINTDSRNRRKFAERTAVNTVIQGSAADLIKKSMIQIFQKRQQLGLRFKFILQIHDELVFEVPQEQVAAVAQLVKQEMQQAMTLKVPLKVNLANAPNWKEAKQ